MMFGRSVFVLVALFVLSACSASPDNNDKVRITGERISVLDVQRTSYVPEVEEGFQINLPEPAELPHWQQVGGLTTHAPGHLVLDEKLSEAWSRDVGSGSSGSYKLLAQPVVAQDSIFAMDARGEVTAYDAKRGHELWERDTAPEGSDNGAIGGGLAYDKGVVFAATGFGEVVAMNAKDGKVVWRRFLGKPLRSAPTISDNRLFVISIENETFALDARTSLVLWQHRGIAESASLMGSSSPAVNGDTVVVAYSSGEVFGLRAQNGRVVWSEVLSMPRTIGALPAIADIRGLPVIDGGHVYTVSHSGRMVALSERRGERIWEADIGSMNTPAVAGNVLYTLSLDNELMALDRETGRVIWNTVLARYQDKTDRRSKPIMWWGPVLANNSLWLTNSIGDIVSFNAFDGKETFKNEGAESNFSLPPIVAGRTLYVLSDDGDLVAFK